ncbi:probable glucuronoxylan glucuronosyltransferase IRX7 isoform X2 [Gastrolobium bilobum]|uniref:probable glucuronoxylan glucuronosyltransferase IRX7 isoform X2 n=1 Tax=Gastrolobium bilobum TaxID=150636 RepID=UPI002AB098CC|nr:probable glucuronoxylan glucuronosyltransferase IRX7 isoform X2 [Gastrolobium bilobum]
MVEQKRPPNNRGYYVRMKLLNKHGRLQQEKSCFYRYYKWVLWLSLSLYFFTSYLISNNHDHAKTTTHVSRTLSESKTNTAQPQARNILGSLMNLKVFVYDLPPKYNTDWLANESTVNGFPAIGHARSLIASAVKLISSEYPFWNRSRGSDHVFVASHDFGSCFHTLEDVAMADGVPEIMKNSIVLQTFGVEYDHPCQEVEHVVIPPYVSPESVRNTMEKSPANGRRDIWVFFRGKMEVHPKNVSGRFYSKKVRTVIWRKFNGDQRFYLRRHRFAGYQSEIARSVFCLCPLGWAPWSPRLVESVALGCVPVVIADGIRLPFSSAVRWAEISVTVAERDVGRLAEILEHVAATNLSAIQRNLWDPRTRRALLFNSQVQEGDATWQVLRALSEKLDRSFRSSRVSRQLDFDT